MGPRGPAAPAGARALRAALTVALLVVAAAGAAAARPFEAAPAPRLPQLSELLGGAPPGAAAASRAEAAGPAQPEGGAEPLWCDVSGDPEAGPSDTSGCTYLVGDPAAARQLLFGEGTEARGPFSAAAAADPAAAGPLPRIRTVARAPPPPPPQPRAAAAAPLPPPPPQPLFHEAAVWLPGLPGPHSVLFSSNRLGNLSTPNQSVALTLVDPSGAAPPRPLPGAAAAVLPMANGGRRLPGGGGAVALLCFQGVGARGGGLAAVDAATGAARLVLTRAGAAGAPLGSPNDVVMVPLPREHQPPRRRAAPGAAGGAPEPGGGGGEGDGGQYAVALFTDPPYGFDQGFRSGAPERGGYLWAVTLRLPPPPPPPGAPAPAGGRRWWPVAVGPARAVADGFVRPNGVAVSPDRKTIYVSDSGYYSGDDSPAPPQHDPTQPGGGAPPLRAWPGRPRGVYAFDLSFVGAAPAAAVLSGRRTFAVADAPAPDGLAVDADGRVWSGEGDGVSVYEPGTGRLLLRVRPGGGGGARSAGVANFALVPLLGDGGGGGEEGGGLLVMGQEAAATAVRLPGLRVFDVESWLER
ncbi:MAG: hypothetical protein J3K34DRAFT_491837 [Monoraphidium minutum]|nr:MAG: hypothetical protein J3K34DRAFT_491837 [Monoraphidium minutum]